MTFPTVASFVTELRQSGLLSPIRLDALDRTIAAGDLPIRAAWPAS